MSGLEAELVDKSLIKRLLASIKCGACGQCYEVDNVDVLGQQEDLWFLGVFCPTCHTQYLVVAVVKEDKVTEVITDLTEAELEKFSGMGGVIADDILDMYKFLKDFGGDFSRLFSRK